MIDRTLGVVMRRWILLATGLGISMGTAADTVLCIAKSGTTRVAGVCKPKETKVVIPGTAAIPGPQGLQGPQGVQGPVGPVGPQGYPGFPGQKGDIGPIGPQGLPGIQGAKGDTGPAGVAGPKGDTGADGKTGPRGPVGPGGIVAVDADGKVIGSVISRAFDQLGGGGDVLTLLTPQGYTVLVSQAKGTIWVGLAQTQPLLFYVGSPCEGDAYTYALPGTVFYNYMFNMSGNGIYGPTSTPSTQPTFLELIAWINSAISANDNLRITKIETTDSTAPGDITVPYAHPNVTITTRNGMIDNQVGFISYPSYGLYATPLNAQRGTGLFPNIYQMDSNGGYCRNGHYESGDSTYQAVPNDPAITGIPNTNPAFKPPLILKPY